MVVSFIEKGTERFPFAPGTADEASVPAETPQDALHPSTGQGHPGGTRGVDFSSRPPRLSGRWLIPFLLLLLVLASCTGGGVARGLIRWGSGWSPTAVSDGVVYVGTRQGEVLALDMEMAKNARTDEKGRVILDDILLWRFKPVGDGKLGGVFGKPEVGDGFIYVADGGDRVGDGARIYALKTDRGPNSETRLENDEWARRLDRGVVGGPALAKDEGLVLAGSDDGSIYFIWTTGDDAGKIAWKFQAEGQIWSRPVIADGVVYFGSMDRHVYAISVRLAGKLLGELQEVEAKFDDGALNVREYNRRKGELQRRLDEETLLWKYATGGAVLATPLVTDGMVVIGSFDKKLYALDAKLGERLWSFKGNGWFWAGAVTDGNYIFASSMDKRVYALNRAGELMWPSPGDANGFQAGSPIISAPVIVGDSLVVATDEGRLHLLTTSSGEEAEFYRDLGGRAKAPLNSDGDLVVLGLEDSTVRGVNVRRWTEVWSVSTK